MKLRWFFIGLLDAVAVSAQQSDYWQQHVDYVINVRLDDELHELLGEITIRYTNNSPDKLGAIWFHLWPNAYSHLNTAFARQQRAAGRTDFLYSAHTDRGYIDQLNFTVNGQPARLETNAEDPDIALLHLNDSLPSGGRIIISTPFHVKIPKVFSRMGHDGQQYQISQWYPKPAVYDRAGWHPMPYLDQGEFYSETGSFDVTITLPENYVVAATGDLQTAAELEFLKEKVAETRSRLRDVLAPMTYQSWVFPESSAALKTIRFTESNVHDLAWFADKRYNVIVDSVTLPSGHKVKAWAFFNDAEAHLWKRSAEYVKYAVESYSKWVGEYPYNNCTAVQGALAAGAGMEYPSITVIGRMGNAVALENVIVHEVGHNWFQGMFATNERVYAWMDEGINSYYEQRYMNNPMSSRQVVPPVREQPQGNLQDLFTLGQVMVFDYVTMQLDRQRLANVIESDPSGFSELQYGVLVYGKAAAAVRYLAAYLGQEKFDQIMQSFFLLWRFNHPTPDDMRVFFENQSDKNLGWFFDGLIGSHGRVDYAVVSAERAEGDGSSMVSLTLWNKGEIASPVAITTVNAGGFGLVSWYDGFHGDTTLQIQVGSDATHIQLDPGGVTLDINPHNNVLKLRGALRRFEPPQFPLIFGLPNPRTSQLFFTPAVAWNYYDGLTAGLAAYNSLFPAKNMEFIGVPMFGFGSSAPVGIVSITRYVYPRNRRVDWSVGLTAKTFHFDETQIDSIGQHDVDFEATHRYIKVQPDLRVNLRPVNSSSHKFRLFRLRSALVRAEGYEVGINTSDSTVFVRENVLDRYVTELAFTFGNRRRINPLWGSVRVQHNNQMVKLMGDFQQNFTSSQLPRDIRLRVFGGMFLIDRLAFPEGQLYQLNLSGPTGANDFMFDYVHLGRSEYEGFLYQQIIKEEGGFKVRTDRYPFGRHDDWLAAINLSVPLPFPVPVDVFADIATFAHAADQTLSTEPFLWEVGFALVLLPEVAEVYFPVALSPDLRAPFKDVGRNYLERITFTLRLEKLNPFKLARELRGP